MANLRLKNIIAENIIVFKPRILEFKNGKGKICIEKVDNNSNRITYLKHNINNSKIRRKKYFRYDKLKSKQYFYIHLVTVGKRNIAKLLQLRISKLYL